FLGDGRIACTIVERGIHSFGVLDPTSGELERLDLPFTASSPQVTTHGTRFAVIAGAPTELAGIHVVDADTATYETVASPAMPELDPASISIGRPIDLESNGRTVHAFFSPPANADYEASDGERPPLRVLVHGGPTSQAKLGFVVGTQFFTTRGWAVVDVN